jgi:4-amino-4-deoxy-L-arabinose transferase-like glycosyltransferase
MRLAACTAMAAGRSPVIPFILWIYQGSQLLVERVTGDSAVEHPVLVIKYIRFFAGLTNTLTILVIGLTARRLGGDPAGILAAVAWAVMPGVTEQTLTALTEAWQVLFITLAVYFTLLALENDSLRWAVLSVLAGLVAVLFKYSAYPALGPGVAVTLWGMRSN